MKLYLVGGAVRDRMLGLPTSKDLDFAVEAPSFGDMKSELKDRGSFRIYLHVDAFVTLRGSIQRARLGDFGGFLDGRAGRIDADFTLCRAEKMYHDNRHPSVVTPTDIVSDLCRRDFTVNAVAVAEDGVVVDPFGGQYDAANRVLKAVGDPLERFEEDPLRILRGVRFAVTRNLYVTGATKQAMHDMAPKLETVKVERVREELVRAVRHDWRATMLLLMVDVPMLGHVLAKKFPRLWLKPTVEDR
jgi:tRNA nucleotidyltransferase/poly(A) polymerase